MGLRKLIAEFLQQFDEAPEWDHGTGGWDEWEKARKEEEEARIEAALRRRGIQAPSEDKDRG